MRISLHSGSPHGTSPRCHSPVCTENIDQHPCVGAGLRNSHIIPPYAGRVSHLAQHACAHSIPRAITCCCHLAVHGRCGQSQAFVPWISQDGSIAQTAVGVGAWKACCSYPFFRPRKSHVLLDVKLSLPHRLETSQCAPSSPNSPHCTRPTSQRCANREPSAYKRSEDQ